MIGAGLGDAYIWDLCGVDVQYSVQYRGKELFPSIKRSSMYGAKAQNAVEAFPSIREALCTVHKPRTSVERKSK